MTRKITLLFAVIIFISSFIHSQNQQKIDSLIHIVSTAAIDTNLAKNYERITKLYLRIQLDSAKAYAQKMIDVSKELDYDKGFAMGNNWLGRAYFSQGDYNTALVYYKITNHTFGKNGENTMWAHSLQSLANVYSMTNKYDTAIALYEKALTYYENNNDLFSASKVMLNVAQIYSRSGDFTAAANYLYKVRFNFKSLNNDFWFMRTESTLAVMYGRQEQFDSAISVTARVIDYYESKSDYYNLGDLYSNLGVLYEGKGDYELAIETQKKGLECRHLVNDPRGLAISEMNVASLYINMENYDSAFSYLESSRVFFKERKEVDPLVFNLMLTGAYYLKTKQFEEAVKVYQEAYKIAKENKLKDDTPNATKGLSLAYEEMHDYKNALKYAKLYKVQYDSLINEENIKEQTVAEEGYKYKLQLLEKEQEIEKERQQKKYLMITGLAVALILILLILYLKSIQKTKLLKGEQKNKIAVQEAKLHTQRVERKRVANILHDNLVHIILNSQSQVKNLISKTDDAKPKQTLVQIEDNLDFMNKLAKVASYELEFSFVLEKNLIDQFDSYIRRVQHSHSPKISFNHSEEKQFEALTDEVKINVFSVFQEMLGNAIKYAKAVHIGITLFMDEGKTILQVDDDGIGFDYNEERHGQGFPNMKERAANLNGSFSFESEKGFGTKLKFVV